MLKDHLGPVTGVKEKKKKNPKLRWRIRTPKSRTLNPYFNPLTAGAAGGVCLADRWAPASLPTPARGWGSFNKVVGVV